MIATPHYHHYHKEKNFICATATATEGPEGAGAWLLLIQLLNLLLMRFLDFRKRKKSGAFHMAAKFIRFGFIAFKCHKRLTSFYGDDIVVLRSILLQCNAMTFHKQLPLTIYAAFQEFTATGAERSEIALNCWLEEFRCGELGVAKNA